MNGVIKMSLPIVFISPGFYQLQDNDSRTKEPKQLETTFARNIVANAGETLPQALKPMDWICRIRRRT